MRVLPSGELRYCRWMDDNKNPIASNLRQNNFIQYFQKEMSDLRAKMLRGEQIDSCGPCARMEEHNKVSGREKQLLKVGIKLDNFEKTFKSSTYYDEFKKSADTHGGTELWPQDWQIDLGNYCNSACIFCEWICNWSWVGFWFSLFKSNPDILFIICYSYIFLSCFFNLLINIESSDMAAIDLSQCVTTT